MVSFIGGGNPSTQRKPPTCCKSLTNVIIYIGLVWFMLFNATFNNISVISYINMSYFYTLVQVRKII